MGVVNIGNGGSAVSINQSAISNFFDTKTSNIAVSLPINSTLAYALAVSFSNGYDGYAYNWTLGNAVGRRQQPEARAPCTYQAVGALAHHSHTNIMYMPSCRLRNNGAHKPRRGSHLSDTTPRARARDQMPSRPASGLRPSHHGCLLMGCRSRRVPCS